MEQKLVFLDIDGTLTEPGRNVPPASALKAIARAQANGHKVFLCTGRNPAMLAPLLTYGFDGVVGCAGGYVTVGDRVIYDCPMTDAQLKTAMEVFARNGVLRTVEGKDFSYGDTGLGDFLSSVGSQNSEMLRWREQINQSLGILPMENYRGQTAYKIVYMCASMAQLDEPESLLGNEFRFCTQTRGESGFVNGEIINRAFDKGRGILRICEALGVSREHTIGFGDSMNDQEMLETVGVSVCMANGMDEMKRISDMVCPAVTEDGLATAFEKLGL